MDVFAALADPTRREILELLSQGEKDVGTVAGAFSISQPAVSRHLKVLRQAGLVEVRTEAQRRIYAVRPAGLTDVDRWLARYREFWAARLDTLETVLREEN